MTVPRTFGNQTGPIPLSELDENFAYLNQGNVDVIASGSITAISLGNRFANTFSPEDFGAVGDGSTDDSVAINAALTFAATVNRGVVLSRAYGISKTITVPANTSLIGSSRSSCGLVVRASANINAVTVNTKSTVKNFYINGSYASQSSGAGVRVVNSATDVLIDGLEINDCKDRFIAVGSSCERVQIINNLCNYTDTNGGIDACVTGTATDILIASNIVRNTRKGNIVATATVNGLLVIGNVCDTTDPNLTGTSLGDNITAYNADNGVIVVSGNICKDSQNNGIHLGGSDLVIIGNHVINSKQVGILAETTPAGLENRASITGNVVNGALLNNGIGLNTFQDFSVTGNMVYDSGTDAAATVGSGIVLEDCAFGTVAGNTVRGALLDGINLSGTVADVQVTGNAVKGATRDGIRLNGSTSVTDCVVSENRVVGCTGYGVLKTGTVSRCRINKNNLRGNTAGTTSPTGINLENWEVLAQSSVGWSTTGDTNENTLATIPMPAGAMGANGALRISTLWSFSGTNTKTARVRLGGISGTAHLGVTLTTQTSLENIRIIRNRNSASSQVSYRANDGNSFVAVAAAVLTGAINTANDQDIVITGQLTNTGESVTLESYCVEIFYLE